MTIKRASRRLSMLLPAIAFAFTLQLSADATDKTTGLELHPGLKFQQEVNSPICRHVAQMNIYDAPGAAALAEYVTWYRSQFKGFHYVHKVWSNRAQEMFYSADGSKGVSVTGSTSGPGVFAVTYMKMSAPLTIAQMDAFGPSNPSCK